MTRTTVGSRKVPFPIRVHVEPITIALADVFWDKSELERSIRQKQANLD